MEHGEKYDNRPWNVFGNTLTHVNLFVVGGIPADTSRRSYEAIARQEQPGAPDETRSAHGLLILFIPPPW